MKFFPKEYNKKQNRKINSFYLEGYEIAFSFKHITALWLSCCPEQECSLEYKY
jgi:hypothetical protein